MGRLVLLALVVAACSSPAATNAPTPTATPSITTATPTATPGPTAYAGSGVITFGRTYDHSTGKIDDPQSTFSRTIAKIAWSASLSEEPDAANLLVNISRVSTSGAERLVYREKIALAKPQAHTLANSADLADIVGHKAGTYVFRYLRGGTVLAEGRFTLK